MSKIEALIRVAPVIFNLILVIWTLLISPYSKYGDNWAVYPAIVIFAVIISWHIGLVYFEKSKIMFVLYGFLHIGVSVFLWVYCLMKISKDSL
jgi:hypothetical protein